MPSSIRHFHRIAARYGEVDPGDSEAVQRWFTQVLPTLPVATVEEILESLLRGDGAELGGGEDDTTPEPAYPRDVRLPSLSASPPAPVPLFAVGWGELIRKLLKRPR